MDNSSHYVRIGFFDLNGVLRGKVISQQKLQSVLEHGGSLYDGLLCSDIDDQPILSSHFTGNHTGFPDAPIIVDEKSHRELPWEDHQQLFLCQYAEQASVLCSRSILQRILAQSKQRGFYPYWAMEYEFTVLDETNQSLLAKQFSQLKPLSHGNFGYSIARSCHYHSLYQDILNMSQKMNMPLESLHTEVGPGMFEGALAATHGLAAADNAALFKAFTKILMSRHDLTATFMAKWRADVQGHGAHIHLSLQNEENKNVFYDANGPHHMSAIMQQFIAGQHCFMPELAVLFAPHINSYARFVPGFWAPTQVDWGIGSRAVSLRVIPGNEKSQHMEYRAAGADCNPYLAFAAALLSGLEGIEQQLALPDENAKLLAMPASLEAATNLFEQSEVAHKWLGGAFVKDYVAKCRWELTRYQQAVTDWELQRYLEMV